MNIRTALAAILILNGLAIGNLLFAADDPQKQVEALQAALIQSQQQTAQANQIQLQMAAEIAALRKEIEAMKKAKEPPK